ncbi:MAG: HIT family protein, partial [Patescibacteria group bacterium]|nr:HIT family protein [Patescibacteria group bacterium]
MQDCLFCKIIGGEIPAKKVYENAGVVAFLDIKPSNPGHLLIVPKKHYKNIFDLPLDAWLEMMKAAHFLAPVTKESVGADGINITMNNEPAAHQIIFHAHVHLIPRFHGDPHKPWAG